MSSLKPVNINIILSLILSVLQSLCEKNIIINNPIENLNIESIRIIILFLSPSSNTMIFNEINEIKINIAIFNIKK